MYASTEVHQNLGTYRRWQGRCGTALALAYGLSIVVRYRPSIWRRVQEGDLDQYRALIESFLSVVERVLPEQFLAAILGVPVYARQPGTL